MSELNGCRAQNVVWQMNQFMPPIQSDHGHHRFVKLQYLEYRSMPLSLLEIEAVVENCFERSHPRKRSGLRNARPAAIRVNPPMNPSMRDSRTGTARTCQDDDLENAKEFQARRMIP